LVCPIRQIRPIRQIQQPWRNGTVKIACLGGGGLYFSRPLGDIAVCPDLHGSEIALYDIDHDRAALMADLARRFSTAAGAGLQVSVARTLAAAVDGCDVALASIGGAGASGASGYYESPVHLGDKQICTQYGIPQLVGDTAGPAAMLAAFRSVPIYLDICRTLERRAPRAILINHANPMAVLCRAMVKHTGVREVIGICHGVQIGIRHAAAILGLQPAELDTVWVGTNHYYWFTRVSCRGQDLLPELWRRVRAGKPKAGQRLSQTLSQVYGHWIVYPEDDHLIEFYPYLAQTPDPTAMPAGLSDGHWGQRLLPLYTGTESIEDVRRRDAAVTREAMLAEYAAKLAGTELPTRNDDPVTGEGIAALVANLHAGRRGVHICNIPNRGAVPNLPATAILEVEAVTDSTGVRPLYMAEAPLPLKALLDKRIAWQEMVADAAVTGDTKLALQAMQVDEQAIPPEPSARLLRELLANSRGMLPTFERRRRR
jgi:alpha-galactosidase